jgi:HEAT repeat protein
VATLTGALDDPDTETLISMIWALASLGDHSVVPRIAELYQAQDSGVRKMVVYALGVLPDDGAHTTLRAALRDPVSDVQWNAAVSLARHGDDRGLAVLQRMLDRDYVSKQVTPSGNVADPVGEVMISGIRAVAALGQDGRIEAVRTTLTALAEADESLKVRQAAMEAIAALEGGALSERVAERQ